MKYVPAAANNLDRRLFGVLLMPSWLSGCLAVVISLALVIGTALLTHYQSSSFRIEILNTHLNQSANPQAVPTGILANSLVSNLPLLIFWTLVGLVVYIFAANMFAAIRSTAELKNELDYVHVNRHELLVTAAKHLLLRLIVLVAWIIYIVIFFNRILPYCVTAALAGSGQTSSLQDGEYILLATLVMAISIHVHAIFLRLLLLRPRIFSSTLYVD